MTTSANKGRLRALLIALMLGLAAVWWSQRSASSDVSSFSGQTMGTTYEVTLVRSTSPEELARLQEQVTSLLRTVNNQMSTYQLDSEISRFNTSSSTSWFSVSPDFARVVKLAKQIHGESAGAFDGTILPLVKAWGFGPGDEPAREPGRAAIKLLMSQMGFTHIDVREHPAALRKRKPYRSLDLSAIAKGFGVDKVAEHLEAVGYSDYLVEIGGEIRVSGLNGDGQPWRVGIEAPQQGTQVARLIFPLTKGSIATSGSYRNYHEKDGVRLPHILDPRSGFPIQHRLISVSVIDETCVRADAWATALMVLGPEAAMDIGVRHGLAIHLMVMTDEGIKDIENDRFTALRHQRREVSR